MSPPPPPAGGSAGKGASTPAGRLRSSWLVAAICCDSWARRSLVSWRLAWSCSIWVERLCSSTCMSASCLSSARICEETASSRLATSRLLEPCCWTCRTWRWRSPSWAWMLSMSPELTQPERAAAAASKESGDRRGRRLTRATTTASAGGPAGDDEVRAAVLRPAALAALGAEGSLFAVTDGADSRACHAQRLQVLASGVGAAVGERQVVLVGAALVAVAFQRDHQAGLRGEELRVLGQPLARLRLELGAVVVEEHVADQPLLVQAARHLGQVVAHPVLDFVGAGGRGVRRGHLGRIRRDRGGLGRQVLRRRRGLLLGAGDPETRHQYDTQQHHPLAAHVRLLRLPLAVRPPRP